MELNVKLYQTYHMIGFRGYPIHVEQLEGVRMEALIVIEELGLGKVYRQSYLVNNEFKSKLWFDSSIVR